MPALDPPQRPSEDPRYSVHELRGGLKAAFVASDEFRVLIRVGAGYWGDPAGHGGLAHLAEHLTFRFDADGSQLRVPVVGQAWTRADFTEFHAEPHSEAELRQFLSRMFQGFAHFPEADGIANEAEIIDHENDLAMYAHLHSGLLLDKLALISYPSIGTVKSLEGVDYPLLRDFANNYYTPDRVVVVVAAPTEQLAAVEEASRALVRGAGKRRLPRGRRLEPRTYTAVEGKTLTVSHTAEAVLLHMQVPLELSDYLSVLSIALDRKKDASIRMELTRDRLLVQCPEQTVSYCTGLLESTLDELEYNERQWNTALEFLERRFPANNEPSLPLFMMWLAHGVANGDVGVRREAARKLRRENIGQLRVYLRKFSVIAYTEMPIKGGITDDMSGLSYHIKAEVDSTMNMGKALTQNIYIPPSWACGKRENRSTSVRLNLPGNSWLGRKDWKANSSVIIRLHCPDAAGLLAVAYDRLVLNIQRPVEIEFQVLQSVFSGSVDVSVFFGQRIAPALEVMMRIFEEIVAEHKVRLEVAIPEMNTINFMQITASILKFLSGRPQVEFQHILPTPFASALGHSFRAENIRANKRTGPAVYTVELAKIDTVGEAVRVAAMAHILAPIFQLLFAQYCRFPALMARSSLQVMGYSTKAKVEYRRGRLALELELETRLGKYAVMRELEEFIKRIPEYIAKTSEAEYEKYKGSTFANFPADANWFQLDEGFSLADIRTALEDLSLSEFKDIVTQYIRLPDHSYITDVRSWFKALVQRFRPNN